MSRLLLHLNLVGAAVALAANLWALVVGPVQHRVIHSLVSVLAFIYATSYTLALTGVLSAETRNSIGQGLAPVVWVVVWTAPAVRTSLMYQHNLNAIRSMIERVQIDE